MSLPPDFVFSQGSLRDYVDCPRRFHLRYVQRVAWPIPLGEPALEAERHLRRGTDFHRLVHQHLLGIPVEALTATVSDPELLAWWENYMEYAPRLEGTPYAEVSLSTPLAGYRLLARLDLVVAQPGQQLVIVDWKTDRKRPTRRQLAERMQTRVYRYVLVAAGARFNGGEAVDPALVQMLYWFAGFPSQPERLLYDAEAWADDTAYLERLAQEVLGALERGDWPATQDERRCRYCQYRSYCQRAGELLAADDLEGAEEDFGFDLDLEQVAEVEF